MPHTHHQTANRQGWCHQEDHLFSDTARLAAERSFESRKGKDNYVDFEFKVHKGANFAHKRRRADLAGTVHGFAARPNISIPIVKEGYEGALNEATNWFKKTLFNQAWL